MPASVGARGVRVVAWRLRIGLAHQLAQHAEQFAEGVRRLVGQALRLGIARQRAQLLAVGQRVERDELGQGFVAAVDELQPPVLDAMQRGGLDRKSTRLNSSHH